VGAAAVETEKAGGPRSRKGAQTRARLLDAAKQVFEEHGFLDARISDIAEQAGLSHGAFYHYFDSKEQVFRELALALDEELGRGIALILDRQFQDMPQERLTEALRLHLETYRREAPLMRVIEQMSRYDPEVRAFRRARHEEYANLMAEAIRQLQRRGLADARLDPVIAAAGLGAMVSRFAEEWFVYGRPACDFDEGVDQFVMLFLNALQLKQTPAF
jgi:AcrR family transcriptional regulator